MLESWLTMRDGIEAGVDAARYQGEQRFDRLRLVEQVIEQLPTRLIAMFSGNTVDDISIPGAEELPSVGEAELALRALADNAESDEVRRRIEQLTSDFEAYIGLVDVIQDRLRSDRAKLDELLALRETMDDLLDDEIQIAVHAKLSNDRGFALDTTRATIATVTLLTMLAVLAAALAVRSINARIVVPIRALEAGPESVARGDEAVEIPVGEWDEFGRVSTAFNRMLEGLADARKHLETQLQQRTGELTFTSQALEEELARRLAVESQLAHAQWLRSIGTLAGGVAHDINNMLCVVMGFTEVALEDQALDAPTRDHLGKALQAADRARLIVAQLLAFSRADVPVLRRQDIGEVVENAIRLATIRPLGTRQFEVGIEPGCGYVLCDATQIGQVVINLLNNAWQADADGTGLIRLKLDRVEVDRHATNPKLSPGPYVRLTVEDQGCGIPPDVVPRIFDPFFTTKPVGVGTGLGLSVVHGIVAAHHGGIAVSSVPGKGTAFSVYFPSAPADGPEAVTDHTGGQPPPREAG